MSLPKYVKIVDVGPRDGLQNESSLVNIDAKLTMINGLVKAGLRQLEAGSFVSPKWVPQMASSDEIFKRLPDTPGVNYSALVPNLKGLERALTCGVKEIAVFTVVSETFSQKNTNCSISEGMARIAEVAEQALNQGIAVRGYVSCIAGCPYEGSQRATDAAILCEELIGIGCYEVSLGDTIGTGTPGIIRDVINAVTARVDRQRLAVHLHDTYGQALANIYAALQEGVSVVDSSVGGLGGCPYANGASGNVATEDLVYMLNGLGIENGVDLDQLIAVGRTICDVIRKPVMSRVSEAKLASCH